MARATLEPMLGEVAADLSTDAEMGKVSVVGAGMKTHPGVAATVFQTLGTERINIEMISTSPIKISCVIRAAEVQQAVRALHTAFDLGADSVEAEHPFRAGAAT
jgi:aspartate kinase